MLTEETKINFTITRKRTYYGKPPLTEDEVDELVRRKISKSQRLLKEAMDVFAGIKKPADLSLEFRDAVVEHRRGNSESVFTSRSSSKGRGPKGSRLLSR